MILWLVIFCYMQEICLLANIRTNSIFTQCFLILSPVHSATTHNITDCTLGHGILLFHSFWQKPLSRVESIVIPLLLQQRAHLGNAFNKSTIVSYRRFDNNKQ